MGNFSVPSFERRRELGLENLAQPFSFLSQSESKALSKNVSCARLF
jgi:hypothetical protein